MLFLLFWSTESPSQAKPLSITHACALPRPHAGRRMPPTQTSLLATMSQCRDFMSGHHSVRALARVIARSTAQGTGAVAAGMKGQGDYGRW